LDRNTRLKTPSPESAFFVRHTGETQGCDARNKEHRMDIYVGNLASDITGSDLRDAFESFGKVATADVVKHGHGPGTRGFGFVVMPSTSKAVFAIIGLDGRNLKGRAITANEVRPRDSVCGFCRTPCYRRRGK
jgi:cold-inducible RNA-binding protein